MTHEDVSPADARSADPSDSAISEDPPATDLVPASEVLPEDFYVRLQPLTMDLVATQLDRIGVHFERRPEFIVAGWKDFVLRMQILPNDILNGRFVLRVGYPVASLPLLAGRCNWWNASRLFLKASVVTALVDPQPDEPAADGRPVAVARMQLDLDLPFPVGVAPVQLQALFRQMIGNVTVFLESSNVDGLASLNWG